MCDISVSRVKFKSKTRVRISGEESRVDSYFPKLKSIGASGLEHILASCSVHISEFMLTGQGLYTRWELFYLQFVSANMFWPICLVFFNLAIVENSKTRVCISGEESRKLLSTA